MRANRRAIDRMIPESIGGYPVNYGFVPQRSRTTAISSTRSCSGRRYRMVSSCEASRSAIYMEDEKGLDSKVVLSRVDADGRPMHQLTAAVQKEIGDYFARYKSEGRGTWSRVPGSGSAERGLAFVTTTHDFFMKCATRPVAPCSLDRQR